MGEWIIQLVPSLVGALVGGRGIEDLRSLL